LIGERSVARPRGLRPLFDVPLRAHFECKEFPGRFRGPKA